MLNIGELQINSNFLLAPMSGVTDYPYREIVKNFKPGFLEQSEDFLRLILHKKVKKSANLQDAFEAQKLLKKIMLS